MTKLIFPRSNIGAMMVALCLLFAYPAKSFAVDFHVFGDMDFAFNWLDNARYDSEDKRDKFTVNQRLRLTVEARVSENLKGVAMFRMAPAAWGRSKQGPVDAGYALDGDGVNLRNRFLFLDWAPSSMPLQIRMGLIPLSLPFTSYRNGILDSSGGGIAASYQFNDAFAATAFWARPFDSYDNDSSATSKTDTNIYGKNLMDEMDLFFLSLPMTFSSAGVKVTPWAMYSTIGKDSAYWGSFTARGAPAAGGGTTDWNGIAENAQAWWLGLAARFDMFDPLSIRADVAYGDMRSDTGRFGDEVLYNSRGWSSSFIVDYKLGWGVPGFFAFYASGSDADDVEKNQQWGYAPNLSSFNEGFGPTSYGFGDRWGVNYAPSISGVNSGHWGLGLQIANINIWKDWSHTIRVAYYQGTNDKDLVKAGTKPYNISSASGSPIIYDPQLMTTEDHAWEVNFNHFYKIYENLEVGWNLGYVNLDRGDNWDKRYRDNPNSWQLATNFKYTF